jgi:hypothetical protein
MGRPSWTSSRCSADVGKGCPKSLGLRLGDVLDALAQALVEAGAKSGKFEIRETQLPPGYDNWFHGTVILPKTRNGKRTPLRVKGFLSSEFGFGLMRGEYNCVAADYFTATRVGG